MSDRGNWILGILKIAFSSLADSFLVIDLKELLLPLVV
jgi:hypothetical protein